MSDLSQIVSSFPVTTDMDDNISTFPPGYDPFSIVLSAEEKRKEEEQSNIQKNISQQNQNTSSTSSTLDEATVIFQSALLDWVDDYLAKFSEVQEQQTQDTFLQQLKNSIVILWIEYAKFQTKRNQIKAAMDAFEAAIHCSVAGHAGLVWKEYALFLQQQKKPKAAQKVYLQALVGDATCTAAVWDENEKDVLWNDFLMMMKRLKNNDALTLNDLKHAVDTEHVAKKVQVHEQGQETLMPLQTIPPQFSRIPQQQQQQQQQYTVLDPTVVVSSSLSAAVPSPFPSSHPQSSNKISNLPLNTTNFADSSTSMDFDVLAKKQKTLSLPLHAHTIEELSNEIIRSVQTVSPNITAEWLARDGDAYPSRPEPPLFSPSPPKWSDASGKDILGTDLALQLIRMLRKTSEEDFVGDAILEITRACWMMTACKEKEANQSILALDEKLMASLDQLDLELEARLSVAGAAVIAVQQMNQSERQVLLDTCNQQRIQLLSYIAWDFRHLLAIQQQLFTKAGVPGFNGPTADANSITLQSNICAFLHSSFFLRARVGEKAHLSMLKSQEERLVELSVVSQKTTYAPIPVASLPLPQHYPSHQQQQGYATLANTMHTKQAVSRKKRSRK